MGCIRCYLASLLLLEFLHTFAFLHLEQHQCAGGNSSYSDDWNYGWKNRDENCEIAVWLSDDHKPECSQFDPQKIL